MLHTTHKKATFFNRFTGAAVTFLEYFECNLRFCVCLDLANNFVVFYFGMISNIFPHIGNKLMVFETILS